MRNAFPQARRRARLTVIGVGNRWRGDDAAGLEVARRLRAAGVDTFAHEGDCSGLVELLGGCRDADVADVAIVDAAAPGAAPGTIRRLRPDDVAAAPLRSSTHAFGVADALELARSLDRMPAALRVYAIEGARFEVGSGLSPAVERAVDELVAALRPRARGAGGT